MGVAQHAVAQIDRRAAVAGAGSDSSRRRNSGNAIMARPSAHPVGQVAVAADRLLALGHPAEHGFVSGDDVAPRMPGAPAHQQAAEPAHRESHPSRHALRLFRGGAAPCHAAPARRKPAAGMGGELDGFAYRSISVAVRTPLVSLSLSLALLLATAPATAAQCANPPRAGIDWRRCLLEERDFARADLTGAVLRDASLTRSNLAEARMERVDARNARFISSELRGADLSAPCSCGPT
jgi:hypothetical protein